MDTPWYSSITIWSTLLTGAAGIAGIFSVHIAPADVQAAASDAAAIGVAIGSIAVIWSHISALFAAKTTTTVSTTTLAPAVSTTVTTTPAVVAATPTGAPHA